MLSTPSFDPFRRFRPRPTPVSLSLSPSSEDDTDDSSPERVRPRILPSKSPRKSTEHRVTENQRGKVADTTLLSIPLDEHSHPSLKHRDLDRAPQPPAKSTLIRRVTSKLHISIPSKPSSQGLQSHPSTRTVAPSTDAPPRSPRTRLPVSPTHPNGFVSKEHREAALRERGLRPPRKDLSQQEREADERLGSVPSPSSLVDVNGLSEAERLKATWLAKNRSSDGGSSDLLLSAPPHLEDTAARPPSTPPSRSSSALSDIDFRRQSGEGRSPSVGRPSISSSVPPLSASSGLEVLHEDPSEQAPMTPALVLQANVPIVVSSPLDHSPSPILMESPISCSFSSLWPGSTAESQSDHFRLPENGETRRGRGSISGGSPRRMGSSLSRAGSRSLSNIRRSVVSSLGLPSPTTLSSVDPPPSPTLQAPRTAISPTIHNIGSILREARDIADAESRRLCELAFLD